jgi:hypothetical protein
MPDIYWLIAAQRRFLEAMETTLSSSDLRSRYEVVSRKLAATFPRAAAVIVRNRFCGYSNRSDLHILLVEVIWRCHDLEPLGNPAPGDGEPPEGRTFCVGWPGFVETELGQPTQTTAEVVKIADDPAVAARELAAWESCRPVGMTHDSILMRLRPGPEDFDPATGPLSVVYEDAHHVIGMGRVLPLEEAVLDACTWGTPAVESIEFLLRCLYERLGRDFYSRSLVIENPRENLSAFREWKNLDRWLTDWKDTLAMGPEPALDRLRIRREVLGLLSSRRHCFIDPVDYLQSVVACPDFCPILLWGCAHGDLHGRNVLVSILDGDVSLPALFDYEQMGRNNAIGWDFVKLETELKARGLPLIYTGSEPEFITQVGRFECYLAESTLSIHDQKGEPKAFDGPEGSRRLAQVILTIRKEARRHLGLQRLRDRQWLEEYYFLLACYGVCASRYGAYQGLRRQIAVAYISAGVAARQLSRPWKQLEARIREAVSEAEKPLRPKEPVPEPEVHEPLTPGPSFDPESHTLTKADCEMSHHARLAFAKVWVRSRNTAYVKAGLRILKQLREEYPHVLEIEEELALAYLELSQAWDAMALLDEVQLRYGQLSEEMLCRFGRLWKDKGHEIREKDLSGAGRFFQLGLDWYQKAHAIQGDYYSGINVATLQFVLGQRELARKTAEAVQKALASKAAGRQEFIWIWATQAEAALLLGNFRPDYRPEERCAEAERLYRLAVDDCPPQAVNTMRRQVELIAAYATTEVQSYWTPAKLDEVFRKA